MALEKIEPFNFNKFKDMTKDSIGKIVSSLEQSKYNSWDAVLKNYSYENKKEKKNYNFIDGVEKRRDFNKKIRRPNENISDVMSKILEWGGMKAFDNDVELKIVESLKILDNENTSDLSKIYADRIASVSKIYEMWNPNKWIIYDSYCARGLQWIVKKFWENEGKELHSELFRFPWPPGRSGAPIAGFPKVAKTAPRQAMLGFVYASWLCRLIAQELNLKNETTFKWEAYHVEMALFTLGHKI